MPATKKHGWHRIPLDLPALAAGAASDTSTLFTYDAFPGDLGTYDPSLEYVLAAALTFDSAVSAVATNNFSIQVSHYSSANVLKNQILLSNVASGMAFSANTPVDLGLAVGGNLTNPTGVTILAGWALLPGDSIVVKRVSNGTGQASPAFTVTMGMGAKA
jgi:hypothetical protein